MVPFGGPLIKVLVYRDRIVLRPALMGERTIMGKEITSIRPGRISFSSVLTIEHTNAGTATPVALNITADRIRAAITRIERTVPAGYETPTGRPASFWNPGTIVTALIALMGVALAIVGIVVTIFNASASTVALAVFGALATIQPVRKLLLARKGTPPRQ